MTTSETKSLELKRDFNIAMAEKVIKQLSFFGAAQNSCRQLQNEIKSRSKSDSSDCLYFSEKYGVIRRNKENWRRGQRVTVTLTKTGEQILKFGIIRVYLDYLHDKRCNSKTGIKKSTISRQVSRDRRGERILKAIHFLVTRGVFGVSYAKFVDQSKENLEPGDFGWDSSRMYRIDCHKEGVSLIDLLEQRDISCSGIFAHIKVARKEAEELMRILLDLGIMKEIGEEDGEIRYGIDDNALTLYIEDYLGLHQTRLSIMGRLLSTVRGIRRGTRQDFDMINYLEENMGANAYEYLLKLEKVRRGLSASARAAYKNEIDIYDEEIKSYQKQIKDREKMYEELEERYPVITTIVKMFTTSDYFDRIDERARKRRS